MRVSDASYKDAAWRRFTAGGQEDADFGTLFLTVFEGSGHPEWDFQ